MKITKKNQIEIGATITRVKSDLSFFKVKKYDDFHGCFEGESYEIDEDGNEINRRADSLTFSDLIGDEI